MGGWGAGGGNAGGRLHGSVARLPGDAAERVPLGVAALPPPLPPSLQEGYDHSYFFISTFIDEHIAFHAKALGLP